MPRGRHPTPFCFPRSSSIHDLWASRPIEILPNPCGASGFAVTQLALCSLQHTRRPIQGESRAQMCPSSLFDRLLNGLKGLARIWWVWEKTNGGVIFQPRGHTDADLGIGGVELGLWQGYGRAQLREAKPRISPAGSSRSSHFRGGRVYRGVKETLSATTYASAFHPKHASCA